MVIKDFRKFNKKIIIRIGLAFILIVNSVSVFADDSSKTLLINPSVMIVVDNARSIVQSTTDHNFVDVAVPVYIGINSDNRSARTYLSGRLMFSEKLNALFTFQDSSGANLGIQYFEPVFDDIRIDRPENSLKLYFDNYFWESDISVTNCILFGYFHFSFSYSASNTNIISNTSYVVINPISNYLYMTESSYGLVNAIVYAIDHSTDIQEIITLLGTLDNDLLNQVVPQLQNINGILGQIYNYLQTLNANQTQNFRQLVYALSGVDLSTTSSSNLSQTTYDRWVHLIYDAINYQEPNASEADAAANDLQSAHDQNDMAQDAAYQGMDSAMESIDFNVTVPQGIINAGLTIGNYVESIYSNLGSDFQFLITVTLTIGLITVIIGAINRYPRSPVTDSVSEVETSGIKNGKRVHSKTTTYRHTTRVRK